MIATIPSRSAGLRAWALSLLLVPAARAPAVAQPAAYDSAAVSVAGSGPATYVLISGLVGGVAGFRRLRAVLVESGQRVIVVDPYRLSVDSTAVTFADLARRVDAVLAHYGVDSARVVGHAHGAGVALRLASNHPRRVSALYFLDVGALAANRTKVFSASLRLLPYVVRIPGGRAFVRAQFLRRLRQNAAHQEWLDSTTQRLYTDPVFAHSTQVVAMAGRLAQAREPDSIPAVVARVHVPVTVLLGDVPHPSQPDSGEVEALAALGHLLHVEHLAGVGHFPHEEVPAQVARLLLRPRRDD